MIAFAAVSALVMGGCAGDDGGSDDKKTEDAGPADATADGGASSSSGGDASASSSSGGDASASGSSGGDAGASSSSSSGGDAGGKTYKHNTCPALGDCVIIECAKAGFKEGCHAGCVTDAAPAVLQVGTPLLSCSQDKCIKGKCKDAKNKAECVGTCMNEACGAQLLTCLDDPKAKGDKTCSDIGGCMEKCDKPSDGKVFSCNAKCLNSGDAAAKSAVKAMFKCMVDNPVDPKDPASKKKQEAACTKPLVQCLNNGTWGKATCGTTFVCFEKCDNGKDDKTDPKPPPGGGKSPGGDNHGDKGDEMDGCTMKCLAASSEKGLDLFGKLGMCHGKKGKDGKDPDCSAELIACIDPQGPNTCGETFGCMGKCVEDAVKAGQKKGDAEGACSISCLGKATKDAAVAFWGLGKACEDGGDKSGSGGSGGGAPMPGGATPVDMGPSPMCVDAVTKCANPSGKDTCTQMLGCIDGCEKKGGGDDNTLPCAIGCVAKADKAEVASFKKLAECQHTCAKGCMKDKNPKTCTDTCIAKDKGCADAAKKCVAPKKP